MKTILEINNLRKTFADFTAVNGINLEVKAGEIFGFLGPNGAGKTTTIKILAGLLQPDSGSVTINGNSLAEQPLICKQDTGYVPDRPWLFEKLTGGEYLKFVASLYNLPEEQFNATAPKYLDMFDLGKWEDHLIESYSHGMRQKLIMTSVFMLNQPLLIIDEPMVGLDPKSARIVKELFKRKAEEGSTIFLSTHSLEIAEELCHRIAIITNGTLHIIGTMEELRKKAGRENQDIDLEEIFLELTGAWEMQQVIAALKEE
ncbi:ABC-2 type transport system ATP-binding protein [Candidatus Electrothrix marina]|uniref:ABC-2 type transport system ATP-binding protein n=2 Tax=Candidatus Electrothrix marina TaxID=1859130 RepID=A0A3S3QW08_9BACT|nr:ABC-2 type transport system ATP-binding protein [Candidatus Electrothrix marina]WLE99236.1 MAG: ABC transporter ATP-binding protein [Candidatus Electrothrix communis]